MLLLPMLLFADVAGGLFCS